MEDMPCFEQTKCNGCGLCVSVCAKGGFILVDEKICTIENAECDNCQQCELVCPTGAISFPFEIVEES